MSLRSSGLRLLDAEGENPVLAFAREGRAIRPRLRSLDRTRCQVVDIVTHSSLRQQVARMSAAICGCGRFGSQSRMSLRSSELRLLDAEGESPVLAFAREGRAIRPRLHSLDRTKLPGRGHHHTLIIATAEMSASAFLETLRRSTDSVVAATGK